MSLSERVYCVVIAFKMTEWVQQWICIKFCIKLEHSSEETIQMIQKDLRDNAMRAAPIKLWHECFKDGQQFVESDPHWKAFNKENTWECWTCTNCNQQRSATDSESTRSCSHFGDSKIYWLFPKLKSPLEGRDFNCQWDLGKYDGAADGNSKRGFCRMFWTVEKMLEELCDVPRCLLWRSTIALCTMFLVSCIFFNKCLNFS